MTATTTWAGLGRRVAIVVGGQMTRQDLFLLDVAVQAAFADGAHRVVIDVSAVVRGDQAALLGLARVRGEAEGWPGRTVDVVGVEWSQFRGALLRESSADVRRLRAVFVELVRPMTVVSLPPSAEARARVAEGASSDG